MAEAQQASDREQPGQGGESDDGAHDVQHIHGIEPCFGVCFPKSLLRATAKIVQDCGDIYFCCKISG
jgi:hypothetical protein